MTSVAAASDSRGGIAIPVPHRPLCTARVLVMERMDGRPLAAIDPGMPAGVRAALARGPAGSPAAPGHPGRPGRHIGRHGRADARPARRPAITKTVTLYAFFGYCLLIIAAILALRVLVLVFRPDTR